MAFQAGDPVHVALFGKGTVREARNGGRYLVDVKGANSVGVALDGDIGGSLVVQGGITSTGYRSITAPAEDPAFRTPSM